MDSFENVIRLLLEEENYWVRQSEKIRLTEAEKRATGKPSIPRPEIDLVALDFEQNQVLALEVKSYLDSSGVRYEMLCTEHEGLTKGRYKLFTSPNYRSIVFNRLRQDFMADGLANEETKFVLGLAAGNVYKNRSDEIRVYFQEQGWFFWGPEDIKTRLAKLAKKRYENNPVVITAKLLLR